MCWESWVEYNGHNTTELLSLLIIVLHRLISKLSWASQHLLLYTFLINIYELLLFERLLSETCSATLDFSTYHTLDGQSVFRNWYISTSLFNQHIYYLIHYNEFHLVQTFIYCLLGSQEVFDSIWIRRFWSLNIFPKFMFQTVESNWNKIGKM